MTKTDAMEWADQQQQEFMKVYTGYFDSHEWCDSLEGDRADADSHGWYARLSAPGYLDCTEWTGPCKTEEGAINQLYELYGE